MKRQCGYRKKGGVYLTVPGSSDGAPIEYFLIDPPLPVDLNELCIGPRGVYLIEKAGVWHVFDVVGEESYPNVCDWVEEARMIGVSRRCELPDYSKLTEESRLVLIHQRAFIGNYRTYLNRFSELEADHFNCPKNRHKPRNLKEPCAGLWWHDVVEGIERNEEGHRERVRRKLECGASYLCYERPVGVRPWYRHAIFAIFPIGQFEVIEDADGQAHVEKLKKLHEAGRSVALVPE